MEQWRPVVGWEGMYEVSDQGRVRSVDRWVAGKPGHRALKRGKVLGTEINRKHPHLRVTLCRDNTPKRYFVHVLVLEAFIGPRPSGHVSRHGVGGPQDNTPTNLQWGTIAQNVQDEVAHGTHRNTQKTRCRWGHLLQGFNIYRIQANPRARICKTCTLASCKGAVRGTPEFLSLTDAIYQSLVFSR